MYQGPPPGVVGMLTAGGGPAAWQRWRAVASSELQVGPGERGLPSPKHTSIRAAPCAATAATNQRRLVPSTSTTSPLYRTSSGT
jgi:hypothetical protein